MAKFRISTRLSEIADEIAHRDYQEQLPDGTYSARTWGEIWTSEVARKAAGGNEWALQFIAERVEGKAGIANTNGDGDRTQEQIDNVTADKLNKLAAAAAGAAPPAATAAQPAANRPAAPAPAVVPAGSPASRLLDLLRNRAAGAQGSGSEPEVPAVGDGGGTGESGPAGSDAGRLFS